MEPRTDSLTGSRTPCPTGHGSRGLHSERTNQHWSGKPWPRKSSSSTRRNFQGDSHVLTSDDPDLKASGVYRDVASAIVIEGIFSLYPEKSYGGEPWVLDSLGGPSGDGCYPSWEDWASTSAGKKIESVNCETVPPPGVITVTGRITGFAMCPEFTDDNNNKYWLAGLKGHIIPPAERLMITGLLQRTSICEAGTTLLVWSIQAVESAAALSR